MLVAGILFAAGLCVASPLDHNPVPSIFDPQSTNAESLYHLSNFVLAITGLIFVVVFSLLVYAIVKFRNRAGMPGASQPRCMGAHRLSWLGRSFRF